MTTSQNLNLTQEQRVKMFIMGLNQLTETFDIEITPDNDNGIELRDQLDRELMAADLRYGNSETGYTRLNMYDY